MDLKEGIELQPWQDCIDRLATTPNQARALLADALAVHAARAELLARAGRRTWEPSPQMPALIIIVDEYAELPDAGRAALDDADSIARLGRATAVTLVAATQRPTQKAMGEGAVRSMMDIRIAFRVRERKDTDLILGQGMLTAGWKPHTLNAPGKFLISEPGHDSPMPARAYLLTDNAVAATATRYSGQRPQLDEASRVALEARDTETEDGTAQPGAQPATATTDAGPDSILRAMLDSAPAQASPSKTSSTRPA